MTQRPVVVIGAGPAGIAAATAAVEAGPVMLLEERAGFVDLPDGIEFRPGTAAWGISPGPVVSAFDGTRTFEIDAGAVVVATGGVDRAWPVPGWELNGVLAPGEIAEGGLRYGVIGPEGHVDGGVAAIEAAGGTVATVVSDLAIARIAGDGRVQALNDVPVDRVVLAFGRVPDPAIVLQARAASAFDRRALIAMPLLAADGATSLPGVFVTGEAAGVTGVEAARAHGERVGRAAATVAAGGTQSSDLQVPPVDVPPLPLPEGPTTVICRAQGVDLATVRAAIVAGAFDVNDLRRRTRAGMGQRGARETMPVLAALLLAADPAIPDVRLVARERPPARAIPFRAALAEVPS